MFFLHHGNDIDGLAIDLATRLAEPRDLASALLPEVVLVPHAGLQRWLQFRLAEHNGVAANIRFLRPGELVWSMLRAAAPSLDHASLPEQSPWDAERLRWRLLRGFEDAATLPASLQDYLRGRDANAEDDPVRAFQLADELATVFDKYQAWRREDVMRWQRDEIADAGDWQARLFQQLSTDIESPSRAALLDGWLRRFGDGQHTPPELPSRLFVFGCLNVSPDVLRLLGIIGQHIDTRFYMPSPCAAYWGDVRSERERLREIGIDAFGAEENRLLSRMGRAGRDIVAQIFSYEQVQPADELETLHEPDPHRSLLSRLQSDVLWRRDARSEDADAPGVANPALADDGSLRVHSCHSRLREIEVLHDQLLALLQPRDDGQTPLRPRDIAVLAPDIDAYAGAVHAVFGGIDHDDPRHIPFSLADQGLLGEHPLPGLFLRLFDLAASAHPLSETLDLLALPAMQRKFGIHAADASRIGDWLFEAGVRHGRGGDAAEPDAFSWRFGSDRLLLGMAMGDDDLLEGIAALPCIEGADSDALDAVLRINARIDQHAAALAVPRTASQWQQALLHLIDELLPVEIDDEGGQHALSTLRAQIQDWAASVNSVDADWRLPREVVRAALRQRIEAVRPHQALLGSGVSFASMVPLRCVPFRVIWVLGMDDGVYPRREPGGDLNRLLADLRDPKRRRLGDRSVREDDRFLFLQLLCAAKDHFHVSHIGFDARSGVELPPAAPVLDLLEAAGDCFADPRQARASIRIAHPLQPFDPLLFDGDARHFSYRDGWLAAARASLASPEPAPAFCIEGLPCRRDARDTGASRALDLAELLSWSRLPPSAFLRDRLDIVLPRIDELDIDREPMALADPLERWQRRQRLLDGWDAAGRPHYADTLHSLRAHALLPKGAVGDEVFTRHWQELQPLWRGFDAWRRDQAATHRELPAFDLDGFRIHGHLPWLATASATPEAAVIEGGRADGRHWLAIWLQHLCRHAAGLDGDSWLYALDEQSRPRRWRLASLTRDTARQYLSAWLQCYRDSLCQPLPLLPRAAASYVRGYQQPARGRIDNPTLREELLERLFSDTDDHELSDPAVSLAFRPRRPGEESLTDPLARRFRELAEMLFEPLFERLGRPEVLS
ncbi:MAG: exodeoxyribonuclease V subunit gamma [Xanthomonadales bacterium]|nr:exodeoxyribonuclease V subunit gamma [Xanthomonadales bacterium]